MKNPRGIKVPRPWEGRTLGRRILGLADVALHFGLKLGTIDSCSWVGAQIGRYSAPRNHPDWHARADAALARLRPDLGAEERETMLARRWANLGRTMCEFSVLGRLSKADCFTVVGAENIESARASGRPIIAAALHLGNWELIASALSALNCSPVGIFQPPRNPARHWLAVHARWAQGWDLLPHGRAGAVAAIRELKSGKALFMAIDEHVDGRIHAPFFGRPPEARGNIARAVRMARMTGAEVMPCWVERTGGARFVVHMMPPVPLDDLGATDEDLLTGVVRINDAIEPVVRDHLDQWLMLHEFRFDR